MNLKFSNKFIASDENEKNEVLIIKDTEICHVGMNGNYLIFEKEELENAAGTLEKVPLVANVTDYVDDHNSSPLNTVGWVYDPELKDNTLFATLEVTHPEIINKIKRKTTKGEREINFVSMGCHAEKIYCNICGEEIYFDSMVCDKGHQVGEKYEGKVCGMIGRNIEFEHVALTNIPADKNAKLGKEVVMMMAKRKRLIAEEEKKPQQEKETTTEEKIEEDPSTPAEEEIKSSKDKLIEALKDKINVLESEVEKIRETIKKEDENMEETKKTISPEVEEEEELKITPQEENPEEKKKPKEEEKEVVDEEESEEKKMEAKRIMRKKMLAGRIGKLPTIVAKSKSLSLEEKRINMYKKLIARHTRKLPAIVAKSKSLPFCRAYYKAKVRNKNRFLAGKRVLAMKNNEQIELRAAMDDRTGNGYRKLFAYAKKNRR